ncbi:MAG: hypothetical protein MUF87_18830 [Anaerolineae bacterium]|jgi:hypothetical protein|nr:hypothetical protein [Anaerolineae bacterium]
MYPQLQFIVPKLLMNALLTVCALLWYLRYPSAVSLTGVWTILWIGLTALLIKTLSIVDPQGEHQRFRQIALPTLLLAPFVTYTLLILSFYPTFSNWEIAFYGIMAWGIAFLVFSGLYFFEGLIADTEGLSRAAIGSLGLVTLILIVTAAGTVLLILEGQWSNLNTQLPDPRFMTVLQWVIVISGGVGLVSLMLGLFKRPR